LQGASGAPVIRGDNFEVCGVIVANIERHLLPAQTIKVDIGDEQIEEINYFLPMGKAIDIKHVFDFIKEFENKI